MAPPQGVMGGAGVNLVWHRADLRLADHPALLKALKEGRAVGLGVDDAPYFRLFNPVGQGERHDPEGRWLRRWAREYPSYAPQTPVVDLEAARRRYLSLAGELLRGKGPPLG